MVRVSRVSEGWNWACSQRDGVHTEGEYSAMRNGSLIRCLRLARELTGQRYVGSLGALAASHAVCERTIRRDLLALEAAGWPVPAWRRDEQLAVVDRRASA